MPRYVYEQSSMDQINTDLNNCQSNQNTKKGIIFTNCAKCDIEICDKAGDTLVCGTT